MRLLPAAFIMILPLPDLVSRPLALGVACFLPAAPVRRSGGTSAAKRGG